MSPGPIRFGHQATVSSADGPGSRLGSAANNSNSSSFEQRSERARDQAPTGTPRLHVREIKRPVHQAATATERATPDARENDTQQRSRCRRFTRRADRRLPPGCYGNLIVNVKRGQSRPKRACGVDPDRHDWATFTFTVIAEVRSCCTEMTKES